MRPCFIALACLLAAGCAHDRHSHPDADFAYAEPRLEPQAPITRYADENRDGVVTREEAKVDPALLAAFEGYDLDKNGKLDRGEFARLEDGRRSELTVIPVGVDEESVRAARPARRSPSLNRTGVDEIRPAEPYKD